MYVARVISRLRDETLLRNFLVLALFFREERRSAILSTKFFLSRTWIRSNSKFLSSNSFRASKYCVILDCLEVISFFHTSVASVVECLRSQLRSKLRAIKKVFCFVVVTKIKEKLFFPFFLFLSKIRITLNSISSRLKQNPNY